MSKRAYEEGPEPAEVQALRLRVQDHYELSISDAQDRCAALVNSTRRAWQQWEGGQRRMHPVLYQFVQLRTSSHELWALVPRARQT